MVPKDKNRKSKFLVYFPNFWFIFQIFEFFAGEKRGIRQSDFGIYFAGVFDESMTRR